MGTPCEPGCCARFAVAVGPRLWRGQRLFPKVLQGLCPRTPKVFRTEEVRRALPVLTVLAVIVAIWYAAVAPMNIWQSPPTFTLHTTTIYVYSSFRQLLCSRKNKTWKIPRLYLLFLHKYSETLV